jgi:hypothetical protein
LQPGVGGGVSVVCSPSIHIGFGQQPATAVGDIDMLTTEDHAQLAAFSYGAPIDE